jgi:hypothetical protein
MLPANRALWETVDPNDALRMETATLETEAVLGVFVARLYRLLLATWQGKEPAVVGLRRHASRQIQPRAADRRGSVLARGLCETAAGVHRHCAPDHQTRLYAIARELCESDDMWESLVGDKFYRYLTYFVEEVALADGLTRQAAVGRLEAARAVVRNCSDGRMDADSFFPA